MIDEIRERAEINDDWKAKDDRRHLLRMVDALCARGVCPCPPKKACLESEDAEINDAECFRCMEQWADRKAKESNAESEHEQVEK